MTDKEIEQILRIPIHKLTPRQAAIRSHYIAQQKARSTHTRNQIARLESILDQLDEIAENNPNP